MFVTLLVLMTKVRYLSLFYFLLSAVTHSFHSFTLYYSDIFSTGEDSGPKQRNVGYSLPDVHGQVWGRDCADCTGNTGGTPESHHCPFDCGGLCADNFNLVWAFFTRIKKYGIFSKPLYIKLDWPWWLWCMFVIVWRRSTRTGRSSPSRSLRWPLLTWSTWELVLSATRWKMFMMTRYFVHWHWCLHLSLLSLWALIFYRKWCGCYSNALRWLSSICNLHYW